MMWWWKLTVNYYVCKNYKLDKRSFSNNNKKKDKIDLNKRVISNKIIRIKLGGKK